MFDCKLPFRISWRSALENTLPSPQKLASCLFVNKNAPRTPPALSKYFHTAAQSLATLSAAHLTVMLLRCNLKSCRNQRDFVHGFKQGGSLTQGLLTSFSLI